MASIYMKQFNKWFQETEHPVWYHRFTRKQQQQYLDEDTTAGFRIAGILLAIVLFGLTTMAISVLLSV